MRDLLLARKPKDFDIGTDAHPQALKRLFRNCRLIGRRFRLAHILFAEGKVIEVATFRRRPEPLDPDAPELLMTSDNVFGTAREDALRRDFTINGLFYDIADFSVIDYVGGLEDLEAGLVRTIGDPEIRFREDPVRMMRAVEFASRLGFAITPDSYEAILESPQGDREVSAPPRHRGALAVPEGRARADHVPPDARGGAPRRPPPGADRSPPRDRPGASPRHRPPLLGAARRAGCRAPARPRLSKTPSSLPSSSCRSSGPGSATPHPTASRRPRLLSTLLEDIVTPIAVRMALPHAVSHRIKQALSIVGRLSHRPDSRLATPPPGASGRRFRPLWSSSSFAPWRRAGARSWYASGGRSPHA